MSTLAKAPSPSESPASFEGMRLETLPRLAALVGPAGIGKTRFLLENFARLVQESKHPLSREVLYLLPSAEHRERIVDLVLRKEMRGFFGERVLTFNRLMQELLKAGDFALATDAERRFLLNEVVSQKGGGYFSEVSRFPGFLDKISEFIGELKESLLNLEDFRKRIKALEKARPEIREKYAALLEIYEAYENRLEALGVKDHRDGLFLLKETARRSEASLPKFPHLFVDGFFDFSRSQMEFLGWLAERSERVTLTLTLDLSRDRQGLFEIPRQTLKELRKLGFETVDLAGESNRRASSPSLCSLERTLFSEETPSDFSKEDGRPAPDSLLVMEATGIRGEVEMIAREIRHLIRKERLNFSDIAVILRRIGPYEGIFRAVFREFRIPLEIHERERLKDSPLARTLASFFKVLLDDWKREDLFNFLKSSYVDRDYDEVCALEIRGLALGILTGRERWRGEVGGPLFERIDAFQNQTKQKQTVEEWIRFTREAIHTFGLDRIPRVYEESARRDFAALRRLLALLEEIRRTSASWGEPFKTFEAFAREFLGLMEVDLFSLHDRDKNRVQIYDVSLARQKEYKVVFLAGLLEKQFPQEMREDPILSDEERRIAGLAERLPRQALERYFFYLGLTRARERIILTYPRFDLEGHEALPSFYVDEVRKLFPVPLAERVYSVSQSLPRLEEVVEEREVEAHLVKRLFERTRRVDREERHLTLSLYNHFLERPSFQILLPRMLFQPLAQIESEAVRAAFFPKKGIFRPTGLEAYGRCPYRYFASEVLQLEEKEEGIDLKQVGILLHDALEHYWRERVEKRRKELEDPATAKQFVRERLHQRLKETPLKGERAYRIELKKAQMEDWLCRMVEKEIEEGNPLPGFSPRYFEFKFGFDTKEVNYLRLYDAYHEDLLLRGKIDRVDVDASGKFGLVIDYKTGGRFKPEDLEFGRALQLPLYLLAIQQHLKLKPAGGQIYQISTAESKGFYAAKALEETGAQTRSKNIYDEKNFDKTLERAIRFSRQFAEGITRAEIPVRPRDCDDRCPFPSVCRIEKWKLPFIYQEIREEDKKNGIV